MKKVLCERREGKEEVTLRLIEVEGRETNEELKEEYKEEGKKIEVYDIEEVPKLAEMLGIEIEEEGYAYDYEEEEEYEYTEEKVEVLNYEELSQDLAKSWGEGEWVEVLREKLKEKELYDMGIVGLLEEVREEVKEQGRIKEEVMPKVLKLLEAYTSVINAYGVAPRTDVGGVVLSKTEKGERLESLDKIYLINQM